MTITENRSVGAARATLERATRHLLSLQHEQGWWKGELETNVTIDAEDLFLRHFLGLLQPKEVEQTATWIRSRQRPDGSWATYFGGPGDLSTSVEAYTALRLAGDPDRRRPHEARRRVHPRCGRRRGKPRVHADVALAPRPLVVEHRPDPAARADPAADVGTALGLLLRLLGAPDDRRALDRDGAPADGSRSGFDIDELRTGSDKPLAAERSVGPPLRRPRPRAAHVQPPPGRAGAAPGAADGGALGRRAAGAGRLAGAASSRRGSGRSSRCARSATRSTIP